MQRFTCRGCNRRDYVQGASFLTRLDGTRVRACNDCATNRDALVRLGVVAPAAAEPAPVVVEGVAPAAPAAPEAITLPAPITLVRRFNGGESSIPCELIGRDAEGDLIIRLWGTDDHMISLAAIEAGAVAIRYSNGAPFLATYTIDRLRSIPVPAAVALTMVCDNCGETMDRGISGPGEGMFCDTCFDAVMGMCYGTASQDPPTAPEMAQGAADAVDLPCCNCGARPGILFDREGLWFCGECHGAEPRFDADAGWYWPAGDTIIRLSPAEVQAYLDYIHDTGEQEIRAQDRNESVLAHGYDRVSADQDFYPSFPHVWGRGI